MPARRRHRHRVGKSLSTRHSCPADAERKCRPLPTRPAGRHCRRQMPTVRARDRGVGIFDPRVGMSRRCASRNPSVTRSAVGDPLRVTAGSVTMAVACTIVSSTWAGARPAAFLSALIRIARRPGSGRGSDCGTLAPPVRIPRRHPGLDPGSSLSGTALARLSPDRSPGRAWTPDRVRGDKRGAETVPFVGIEPVPKLNRTAAEQVRP